MIAAPRAGPHGALAEALAGFYRRNAWSLALTAMWALAAGFITYFGWLEPSWLSYPRLPFPTKQQEYRAGEAAVLTVTRCNASARERQYNISHVLVRLDPPYSEQCPRRIILQPGLVPIDSGCTTEDSAANVVPGATCPGRYRVEGQAETQATVRTVLVPWRSEPFTVLPKEAK